MLVTCVHVWVKEENIQDFIEASRKNHQGSIQEPGCLRFDILQSSVDPCRFLLYEAYESAEAAAAHKGTGHYLAWRMAVAEWMEKPREGVPYKMLCPSSRDQC